VSSDDVMPSFVGGCISLVFNTWGETSQPIPAMKTNARQLLFTTLGMDYGYAV